MIEAIITPKQTPLTFKFAMEIDYNYTTKTLIVIPRRTLRKAQAFNNITTQEQLIAKVTEVIKNEAK